MPHPHRRCGGGRVTPKGTRPGEHRHERRSAGTPAEERSVWIDFERSDGEVRGLGVSVNGSQGAHACHFVYGPSIEAIGGPFARQPHAVMRPLGLADARATVEAALERRDQTDLDYDGDPLCWSPPRVEHFLSVWIPAKSVCDDEWHDVVEWVFPLWLRFAAERRSLAAELLELNLQAARESLVDMRANAADPTMRSSTTNIVTEMLEDGIDISDEATVQEWIDRYNARPRHERY